MGLDTKILDNIKGAANPTLNVEDVQNAPSYQLSPAEQAMFNEQRSSPSTGALSPHDYYPTLNSPINVGNYSGSVIGSTSLFAPEGALVPIGMMDARDAAVQRAALQKAKEVQDFRAKLEKDAPTSKLVGINEDLTNEYFNHLDSSWEKALDDNGGDANKAMYALQNNPDFQRKTKSFHDLKASGDAVFNKIADVQDRQAKGEVISPELQMYMKKAQEALDPQHPDFKNLSNYVLGMDAEQELGHSLNNVAKDVFMQENPGVWSDTSDPDFLKSYESSDKFYTPEHKQYMKETLKSIYPNSTLYSPQRIDKAVEDFASAHQKTLKQSIHNKPSDKGDVEDLNVADISEEKGSLLGKVAGEGKTADTYDEKGNVKTQGQYGTKDREGNFTQQDGLTFKKPVNVVIPAGADVTDMETGKKRTDKAVRNATIGGIYNAYTYKGQIVDDEFMKDPKKAKLARVTPMVTAIFKEKDEEGKEVETTGHVPLEQVKNSLRGKRNQNDKVLDEYFTRAKEKTAKLGDTGKANITETQSKATSSGTFYTVKGKKYHESALKKAADASGMTIQEYLKEVNK